MDFTGSWVLIYASKKCVSRWLTTLNISNNSVIGNDGSVMEIKQVNENNYLAGGLLFFRNNQLFRIGKSSGSVQVFVRKEHVYD